MLREKTQRRLFRVLFALGCIIPTLLIGGWAIARFTPIYKMIAMSVINKATGLEVNCRSLATPRHGEYRLTEVEIHDPVTERLLAKIDDLTVRQLKENAEVSKWEAMAGRVWIAEPTESTEERFPLVLTDYSESVRCSADSVTIASEANTWHGVKIEFKPFEGKQPAKLIALAAASETRLEIAQHQVKHSVSTQIQLQTGSQPIALDLLPLGEEYDSATQGGEFAGYAEVTIKDKKLQGLLKKSIIKLSKGSFKLGKDPISWNNAEVQIDKLSWFGPVVNVQASVLAQDGMISSNTIWGMNQHLQCVPTEHLSELWAVDNQKPISFDHFDLKVSLNLFGLTLKTENPENALITLNGKPLMNAPKKRLSPLSIVRAFYPSTLELLPSNPEAHRMVRMLMPSKIETE